MRRFRVQESDKDNLPKHQRDHTVKICPHFKLKMDKMVEFKVILWLESRLCLKFLNLVAVVRTEKEVLVALSNNGSIIVIIIIIK